MDKAKFLVRQLAQVWSKNQNRRGRLLVMGVMLFITAGLLFWLVYRQREILLAYQWQFRPWPILLSFVFYSFALFQTGLIWYQIISALGNRLGFAKNFRYFCITNLGKRLPGSVWYIPWRAKIYQEQGLSLRSVSIASGIELVVLMISGAIISLLFALPSFGLIGQNWPGMALMLAIMLVFLHPAVIRKLGSLFHVSTDEVQYRQILQWVGLYLLFWLVSGCMLFFVVNIFIPLELIHLPYVIGSWSLAGVLSMSLLLLPSNFGMTEISISLLLSRVIPSSVAVVVAIGSRILLLLYEIAWAGLAFWLESRDQRRTKPSEEPKSE